MRLGHTVTLICVPESSFGALNWLTVNWHTTASFFIKIQIEELGTLQITNVGLIIIMRNTLTNI